MSEISDKLCLLKKMLRKDEGFQPFPYRCPSGYLTIGFGRNLDAKGIDENEATILLFDDIAEAELVARDIFTDQLWSTFSRNRQFAIINMIYNLGAEGFIGFRRTIAAIKEGNWQLAAEQALDSIWAKQVGARAERIALMLREDSFPY